VTRKDLPAPNSVAWIEAWSNGLAPQMLQAAGVIPSIWSVSPPTPANAQSYQQRLDRTVGWAMVLDHIVSLGFSEFAKLDASSPDLGPSGPLLAAWDAVDALAWQPSDLDEPALDITALDSAIATAVAAAETDLV
jgi:hypothetical protein